MKIFTLFILLLSGCATISSGYIPMSDLEYSYLEITKEYRKDITFSLSYYSQVGTEESASEHRKMVKAIREHLQKTKLFKKVHYVSFEDRSNYHYHFDMKSTGTPPKNQIATAMLAGYTLTLIPMWMNFNIDTTMFLYVNNKEVYSVTAPENIKDVYWLPFIVISPFFNHMTTGAYVRNKTLSYFMIQIINNQLYIK